VVAVVVAAAAMHTWQRLDSPCGSCQTGSATCHVTFGATLLLLCHFHCCYHQVKEAFRKLVWQYHPDKAKPDVRAAAEAKFKEVGSDAAA
jgi:hypothetical protein